MDVSSFINKPLGLRAIVAIALVFSALLLAHLVWLLVDRPINSPLFLTAMILTAWLCGFRLAVVAAVLSGLAIKFFFVAPLYQFVGGLQDTVRISVFVIEGIFLAWLIERLRIVNEKIQSSHEELKALSEHQQSVRESEQKRIAREIHDELGQTLTGVKMDIHHLKRQVSSRGSDLSPSDMARSLDELSGVIDESIGAIRRISSELRPAVLDDFGLIAALEWQAEEFGKRTQIPFSFRADIDTVDIAPDAATAVFRIFQEALTNIARHARATKFDVDIETLEGNFVMRVRDNGRGIAPATLIGKHSLGLLGIRERSRLIGANVRIGRAQPSGTCVELIVPLGHPTIA